MRKVFHSNLTTCARTHCKPQAFVRCIPTPGSMHVLCTHTAQCHLYSHRQNNVILQNTDDFLHTCIHAQQTASSVGPQQVDCLNHIECARVAQAKVRSDRKTAALPSMWTVLSSSYIQEEELLSTRCANAMHCVMGLYRLSKPIAKKIVVVRV